MSDQPFVWVTQCEGTIQKLGVSSSGEKEELNASDISVGADETLWVLVSEGAGYEENALYQGSVIKYRRKDEKEFKSLGTELGAIRIDGGPKGRKAYAIDSAGAVLEITVHDDDKHEVKKVSENGFAREVSVGPDGVCWVVSNEGVYGGCLIKYYHDEAWSNVSDSYGGIKVTNAGAGKGFYVDTSGNVFSITVGGEPEQLPLGTGFAREVSVGPEGNLWVATNDAKEGGTTILMQPADGGAFHEVDGTGNKIDAGF